MRAALVLLLAAAYVMVLGRGDFDGKSRSTVESAQTLVARGTLDLGPGPVADGEVIRAGRRLAQVGPGAVLVLVPFVAASHLVRRALGASSAAVAGGIVALSSLIAAVLGCLVFYRTALRNRASPSAALATTLLLGFSTAIFASARLPDGAALEALLLLLAFEFTDSSRPPLNRGSAALGGLAAGGLVMVDSTCFALGLALVGCRAVRAERVPALVMVAVFAACATPALAYGLYNGAFAEPAGDLVQGAWGLLMSTGKSAFLYNPPLALLVLALPWWWRVRAREAQLICILVLVHVLAVSRTEHWHGDPSWGPTRLVVLIPVALQPVAPWLDRVARTVGARARAGALTLGLVGGAVQLLGMALPPSVYLRVAATLAQRSGAPGWFAVAPDQVHFIPQFSPILGHAWLLEDLALGRPDIERNAPCKLIVPHVPPLGDLGRSLRLDWWASGCKSRVVTGAWMALLVTLIAAGAMGVARRAAPVRNSC